MNDTNLSKKKVILGLSGGVDSTTAALLLKEKGFEVTGLYFETSEANGISQGRKAAEKAAEQLGIELIYRNAAEDFEKTVIRNFCSEYMKGRTPNPCIICNPTVKFRLLTEAADAAGAYYIATGHYARIKRLNEGDAKELPDSEAFSDAQNGAGYFVRRAKSEKKDQSYMLYRLPQSVLSRLILPLGEYESKESVRGLARQHSLSNSEAADSQEICFISDDEGYVNYLKRHGFEKPCGNFLDKDGNVLGKHKGILNYTVGQRKGLGITFGRPVFVTEIRSETNEVILADNEDLFGCEVISSGNFFTGFENEKGLPRIYEGMRVKAKIRYAAKPSDAVITRLENGLVKAVFDVAQRAKTPGQSIVFYDDDLVIGGGFIE
ncbi:MAG: tRNA 2-thiouridine(34) synthase MnmA [Clostridia bacterium]|nr:tRNA 2-thiouridine(34) synthase MnmA [Clostridia bacterium]